MKEITPDYLKDWKVTKKFREIYHKKVYVKGILDINCLSKDEKELYSYDGDIWDSLYAKIINIDSGKDMGVYIGSSLKILLEYHGMYKYQGPIVVYGKFGINSTTKTHVAKVFRADILNEKGELYKTLKGKFYLIRKYEKGILNGIKRYIKYYF